MKIYVDSANIESIKRVMDLCPVAGVTTNPTILSREKRNPWESLYNIRRLIGDAIELHTQVVSQKTEDMVEEAQFIVKRLGKNTFIKVPVSFEGFKAIRKMKSLGLNVTATAVFTPMQALIASLCGATYLAPYVNRVDMISGDGVSLVQNIQSLLEKQGSKAEVLAASFKSVEQILRVALTGAKCITASPSLWLEVLRHPLTDHAIQGFTTDFEKLTAPGKTLATTVK